MSKVFVIGLDGGTFRIIDYLVAENRLPNFSRILSEGSRATLLSSRPPLTPAAWASFYTGSNPGAHGAVDFFTRRPGTYKLMPINANSVGGVPLWEVASKEGKRVCVYNVPVTYPAPEVNGILISGMDAPRLDEKAVFPHEFREELLSKFPEFEIEASVDVRYLVNHSKDPVSEYIQRFQDYLQMQIDVTRFLMQKEDWDLFISVFRSTDGFQHAFWRDAQKVMEAGADAVSNDTLVKAEAVFRCYEALDRELGETWLTWGEDRNLVIMSDHGFGELKREVCINRILSEAGLLTFRKKGLRQKAKEYAIGQVSPRLPQKTRKKITRWLHREDGFTFVDSLIADVNWQKTKLYTMGQFGCLFSNLQGREPLGVVSSDDERKEVLRRAERAFSEYRDPEDGRPLLSEFLKGDEIYHGPRESSMPDAVVVMRNHSYRGVPSTSMELSEKAIIREPNKEWQTLRHSGCHRREGILMLAGPDIKSASLADANIVDIAPTVLQIMGLSIPAEYDGNVLTESLQSGASEPVARTAAASAQVQDGEGGEVYSEEDEEEVRKRLQDLGYL